MRTSAISCATLVAAQGFPLAGLAKTATGKPLVVMIGGSPIHGK